MNVESMLGKVMQTIIKISQMESKREPANINKNLPKSIARFDTKNDFVGVGGVTPLLTKNMLG